ncbi:MAG: THUMP domain-containing protein, partial [Clostridiales Family XIII bacterium]|nr:THUMP domain-containing protein [Clostridiales Family XIII bacterium]
MNNILIARYGEVALKGMNKPWFERVLEGRIRKALDGAHGAEAFKVERSSGLIVVSAPEGAGSAALSDSIIKRISKVFGVASVSPALRMESRELSDICEAAAHYMRKILDGRDSRPLTFKIFGKRSDKTYPVTSPELAAKVGEAVLDALGDNVKVDVNNPEVALTVHLRPREVFIYDEKYSGYGGLPLGTNGKGLVLLSGGIDSPVAAWLMAKRGMRVEAVHFHSYPYTSKRAQEKVEELAAILAS